MTNCTLKNCMKVLCTVTLGAPGDAQRLDSLVGPSTKRFMLHYSFPPFSINEVGKRVGLNRREVGHGRQITSPMSLCHVNEPILFCYLSLLNSIGSTTA